MYQKIPSDWHPTEELLKMLLQIGINSEFALAQVLEFRIYWSERGAKAHGWNSKFMKHCVHEWRRYEVMVARGESSCAMSRNWRANKDTYDVLAKAGIPTEFADAVLPEFIIYWCDRGDISSTWNTKFIGHVRFKWHSRFAITSNQIGKKSTRQHSLIDDLTNRDWAAEYRGGHNDEGS